jgi:HSP20 family molecular chaperone IbpA
MADMEGKSLLPRDKTEVTSPAEPTRPGLSFTPTVDIFETDHDITLLADMPGVNAEDLIIDLRENVLTLSADVVDPEGPDEVEVLREYRTGSYYRQFSLSEMIDQAKIEADLKDGVLGLKLPKVEAAQPRRMAVKAS